MNTQISPIAFFAYNRPKHTELALESLSLNHMAEDSELFIYCDGPKTDKDRGLTSEVRKIVKGKKWCGTVHVIEREKNMGLANSIIAGVTELCEKFGRAIVLEDDLILSPHFLDYMNTALDVYQDDSEVMQISGHMFPVTLPSDNSTLLLSFISSWGWATWNRAWKHFDEEISSYHIYIKSKEISNEFDLNGAYPYTSMLRKQLDGEIDSWAIRWNFSVFLRKGLVLYPMSTLVKNIGFDGTGTHCVNNSNKLEDNLHNKKINIYPKQKSYDESSNIVNTIRDYLYNQQNNNTHVHSKNIKSKTLNFVKYIFAVCHFHFGNITMKKLYFSKDEKDKEIDMNISVFDASTFNNDNLIRKKYCNLTVGKDSMIPGKIIFERENACLTIGQRVFMNGTLFSAHKISIGDDVMISWGVTITDHDSHSISFSKRSKDVVEWRQGRKDWSTVKISSVKIHDKVWIGFNSIILKGITIGEGSIIGAGSVVTKDVPEWTIVAGNPARIIRHIPEDER